MTLEQRKKRHWDEEFHVYGMVTTIEDHNLPQAEIDLETWVGNDVDPSECEACQKEYLNRPNHPVKGWDFDTEPIAISTIFDAHSEPKK